MNTTIDIDTEELFFESFIKEKDEALSSLDCIDQEYKNFTNKQNELNQYIYKDTMDSNSCKIIVVPNERNSSYYDSAISKKIKNFSP